MKTLIAYLIPPVVGALIGYLTNAIAIRMLFRPLKEIRLFAGRGIRLPFTPGILPRQRHKLADSIGAMVERELLTPAIIRERLNSDSVRGEIARTISRFTEKTLQTTLGAFKAPLDNLAAHLPAASSAASVPPPLPVEILRGMGPAFADLLDSLTASLLETALKGAGGEAEGDGAPLADLTIARLLGGEKAAALREQIEAFIRKTLNRQMTALPLKLKPLFFDLYPDAEAALVRLLDRPEVRREMEIQGRIFLDNAIQKLSAVQRFFISAGQYDITLSERMPEIIDDLVRQLENLLADTAARTRIADYLSDAVFSLAAVPSNYERLVRLLSDVSLSFEERTVGEVLGWFGVKSLSELAAAIRRFLVKDAGAGEGFSGAALSALASFLSGRAGMTAGEFLSIDEEKKRRIDAALLKTALSLADRQAETVLKTINVRAMVTARIDSLDMLRVERIILDVMAGQLKWINFFGAILGALIGGVQVAVSAILK
jgi:uncharacterized membrane protein YheB (UPF0754 family)